MISDLGISLEQAAESLGVHYQTIYRWVRSGRLPAEKINGSYVVRPADLDQVNNDRKQPQAAPPPSRARIERQCGSMSLALRDGNESKARSLVTDLLSSGMTVTDLIESVLVPPLVDIGAAWHDGKLDIYVEHRAAAIVERLLGLISPNPRGRRRGRALVAAVSGDAHSLPTTMATAALREDNWHVEHLGADVPPAELVRFAAGNKIDVAVLSCSIADRLAVEEAGSLLETTLGIPTLVGGAGQSLTDLQLEARAASRGVS